MVIMRPQCCWFLDLLRKSEFSLQPYHHPAPPWPWVSQTLSDSIKSQTEFTLLTNALQGQTAPWWNVHAIHIPLLMALVYVTTFYVLFSLRQLADLHVTKAERLILKIWESFRKIILEGKGGKALQNIGFTFSSLPVEQNLKAKWWKWTRHLIFDKWRVECNLTLGAW